MLLFAQNCKLLFECARAFVIHLEIGTIGNYFFWNPLNNKKNTFFLFSPCRNSGLLLIYALL